MNETCDSVYQAKKVGILGATGTIGRLLEEILRERNLPILKGSRGLENGPDTKKVDINDFNSLKEFVDECDIIINCTGPSLITSKKILPMVIKAGKDYIDAFGWISDGMYLKQGNSRIVLNAGSVPGILSILICSMYKSETQEIKVWSGGREAGSIGSVGDIILSSINDYGESSCYIEKSETVKDTNTNVELFNDAERLPDNISAQLVLTNEMKAVAKYLDIRNLRNYTIWADEGMKRIMMFGCMEALQLKEETELEKLFTTVAEKINNLNKSRQSWFVIVIEFVEKFGKIVLKLETSDSAKLTATMLAHITDILIHRKILKGIYWPFEIVDPDEVLKFICDMGISVDIHGEL